MQAAVSIGVSNNHIDSIYAMVQQILCRYGIHLICKAVQTFTNLSQISICPFRKEKVLSALRIQEDVVQFPWAICSPWWIRGRTRAVLGVSSTRKGNIQHKFCCYRLHSRFRIWCRSSCAAVFFIPCRAVANFVSRSVSYRSCGKLKWKIYTTISLTELVNGLVLLMLPIYFNALERMTVLGISVNERRQMPWNRQSLPHKPLYICYPKNTVHSIHKTWEAGTGTRPNSFKKKSFFHRTTQIPLWLDAARSECCGCSGRFVTNSRGHGFLLSYSGAAWVPAASTERRQVRKSVALRVSMLQFSNITVSNIL